MIRKSIHAVKTLFGIPSNILSFKNEVDGLRKEMADQKILTGKILSQLNKNRTEEILRNLQLAEFRVFSQWGDDGIIQFLTDYLEIEDKTFVEFGVENYSEANTRFLLMNNSWRGLVMDGSADNIRQFQKEETYWRYDIRALPVFITKENINSVIKENGFDGNIGVLHIDLDGNDYWIWKELKNVFPVVVIVEYNSVFGSNHPWTIPYNSNFSRTASHFSNLYFGSSLLSLCDLAKEKNYAFVGSNSSGNNAYFVRKDKLKGLKVLSAEEGYVLSKYRESRNRNGELTYLSGADRLNVLKGMDVFNTRTGETEKI